MYDLSSLPTAKYVYSAYLVAPSKSSRSILREYIFCDVMECRLSFHGNTLRLLYRLCTICMHILTSICYIDRT